MNNIVQRARLQIKIVEAIRRIDRIMVANVTNRKRCMRLLKARRILVSIDEGRFEILR